MRHGKSWQKDQSGDDALEKPFETTITITSCTRNSTNALPLLYLPTTSKKIFHYRLETDSLHYYLLSPRILVVPIHQKDCQLFHSRKHFDLLLFELKFIFIRRSLFDMQQLSNDTVSWNLIDAPLPSPLFSNSNVYGNLADASTTIPGISG